MKNFWNKYKGTDEDPPKEEDDDAHQPEPIDD